VDEFTDLDAGNIVPALVATGVWLAVGAALDIYLLRSNKSHLITDVLRVLGLHVADVLGKADPFSGAGRFIKTRRGVVMLVPVPSLSDADTGN
jgi:hypothetical protein